MVPFPAALLHTIIVFFQRCAVEGTDLGFLLLNVPVIRDDTVFVLSNMTIRVDEGCSGIRSTISLVITSIVAGIFSFAPAWQSSALWSVCRAACNHRQRFTHYRVSLLANYVDNRFIWTAVCTTLGGTSLSFFDHYAHCSSFISATV